MKRYPPMEDLFSPILRVDISRAGRLYAPVIGGRYLSVTFAGTNTARARLGGEYIGCSPCRHSGISQVCLTVCGRE